MAAAWPVVQDSEDKGTESGSGKSHQKVHPGRQSTRGGQSRCEAGVAVGRVTFYEGFYPI